MFIYVVFFFLFVALRIASLSLEFDGSVVANVLQTEKFCRHATSTAVPFLFPLHYQILYIIKNMCMYIYMYTHISDCIQPVYELPLLPNNTASEIIFHNTDRCKVLIL
jgi:hypothetical protein